MEFLTEPEVRAAVMKHLAKLQYKIVSESIAPQHGTDIIAVHDGTEILIELKGNINGSDATRIERFGSVLYQLMREMTKESRKDYVIAIPETLEYLALRIRFSLETLGVRVWIATSKDTIRVSF